MSPATDDPPWLAEAKRETEAFLAHARESRALLRTTTTEVIRHCSGVLVTIGGRFFVATCGHVFLDANSVHVIQSHPREHVRPRDGNMHGSSTTDALDLGWLELPLAVPGRFLRLDELNVGPIADGERLYLCGVPGDHLEDKIVEGADEIGVHATPIGHFAPVTSTLLDGRDAFDGTADRGRDVFVQFVERIEGPLPNGWERKVPEAPGLSGCGFYRKDPRSSMWSPADSRLVAIQRSEHSLVRDGVRRRLLRATLIEHWLRMLATDLPELAGEIETALRGKA